MTPAGLVAVGLGAAVGAWCRWGLSALLNRLHPALPLGTLVANVIGAFLMGAALGLLERQAWAPEWRLLAVTGFLGGLTTFSAFTGESLQLIHRGAYGWVVGHTAIHVLGTLAAALIGYRLAS
ncbi:MAG: fluoride efflux transporter CrcB [Burkholderiales bacterium]|nr:MAG: fluoride efflux transporter CrcB [Burkholderiales bacterium]